MKKVLQLLKVCSSHHNLIFTVTRASDIYLQSEVTRLLKPMHGRTLHGFVFERVRMPKIRLVVSANLVKRLGNTVRKKRLDQLDFVFLKM